jgi:hypothetical protein
MPRKQRLKAAFCRLERDVSALLIDNPAHLVVMAGTPRQERRSLLGKGLHIQQPEQGSRGTHMPGRRTLRLVSCGSTMDNVIGPAAA